MLDALRKGPAAPEEIAQLAPRRAQQKIPEISAALEGYSRSDPHRQMMRYSREHRRFIEDPIDDIDREMEAKIHEAGLDRQGERAQSVPGVQERSAGAILAETGGAMQQFETRPHPFWGRSLFR
jgi:transposase